MPNSYESAIKLEDAAKVSETVLNDTPSPSIGLNRNGSPYSEVECEEIIAKLEQLLDGEMDQAQEKSVLEMVNNCQYCLEQYNIEKSFRKLIKNGISSVLYSSSLIFNIKSKIRSARNKSEDENGSSEGSL